MNFNSNYGTAPRDPVSRERGDWREKRTFPADLLLLPDKPAGGAVIMRIETTKRCRAGVPTGLPCDPDR